MLEYYTDAFNEYENFSGRSSRKAFFSFHLVNLAVYLAIICLGITFRGWGLRIAFGLFVVYSLIMLLPAIAVTVRRLHDIGKSGTYTLLACIPVLGVLILAVLCSKKGIAGVNEYGMSPDYVHFSDEEEFV